MGRNTQYEKPQPLGALANSWWWVEIDNRWEVMMSVASIAQAMAGAYSVGAFLLVRVSDWIRSRARRNKTLARSSTGVIKPANCRQASEWQRSYCCSTSQAQGVGRVLGPKKTRWRSEMHRNVVRVEVAMSSELRHLIPWDEFAKSVFRVGSKNRLFS